MLYAGYNITYGNITYICQKGIYENWLVLSQLIKTSILLSRLMPISEYNITAMQTRYHTGWLTQPNYTQYKGNANRVSYRLVNTTE